MSDISSEDSPRANGGPQRHIPQIDRLARSLDPSAPHALRIAAARTAASDARRELSQGRELTEQDVVQMAAKELSDLQRSLLQPVINATGVILHTNLGRAPLPVSAIEAIGRVASGYSNLEFDLTTGKRGSRYDHAAASLRTLTGAESCLVVNNNAAAILLVLSTLARDREVIISRGELVEIGGEFRVPDIMAASGALLKEVGTTNRTHLKDYERAIGSSTAALLKVHPSNYKVIGYTASVEGRDLAALASERGILFFHDVGSGMPDAGQAGLQGEAAIRQALSAGADLVTFSGDKLLGGPQAGVIAGRADLVDALRRSPMLRALRVDKMTLAALEATLMHHLREEMDAVPVWRMIRLTAAEIEQRAIEVTDALRGADAKISLIDGASTTGGGSAPGSELPTVLVEVVPRDLTAQDVFQKLLRSDPPVVARREGDALLLDLRTVAQGQETQLIEALRQVL